MKTKTQARKFTAEQIKQASAIDLAPHFLGRLPIFGITIDDVNTVDRDDGIWLIELKNGGFELQVSITDVSALIAQDSPIDQEALARVVTLYHTNPVTPMLPCAISTNLGSLEDGQTRLALTVFFQIDSQGKVNSFCIKETIFRSIKAFNYEEVENILANPRAHSDQQLLVKLQQIAQLLARSRNGKSGILTEEGYLDEDGNLIKENVNTHQLIAELMILTNTTIANFLAEQKIAALYRTQDVGIEDLAKALKEMGHCLVPATYAAHPKPHVGLGLPAYCHFTSPLRRFVDLVNHRIIKALIHQQNSTYSQAQLEQIAEQVNDFQHKYKLDRAKYLKIKKQRYLESRFKEISSEEVEALSTEEFSDLIQYSASKSKVDHLIPQIQRRISQLQTKDFYYLWFVAKVEQFFDHEEIDAISVLLIKSQLEDAAIDYQIDYCELRKLYFSYCYLNGLTSPHPAFDQKKAKAKNQAALAVIKAYVNQELTKTPNPIPQANLNNILNSKLIFGSSNNNFHQNSSGDDLDLANLSEKEFSKILAYAIKTKIESEFLAEVGKRIKKLPPKDLYKLWFEGKINCFFDYPNFDAVSVLVIHSQLTGAKIEYQVDYHFETENFIASCYVDGLTSPSVETDLKKARVKQKAALAYIKSYLNNTLTAEPQSLQLEEKQEIPEDLADLVTTLETEKPRVTNQSQPENQGQWAEEKQELNTDWISLLHKFCQVKQIDYPEYDFITIDGFFSCSIKLNYHDGLLTSQSYGKSKKEAKQNASKILMIQHNLLTS